MQHILLFILILNFSFSPIINAASIDNLPSEILVNLLIYCNIKSLGRLEQASKKYLNFIESNDNIWRIHAGKFLHRPLPVDSTIKWKEFIKERLALKKTVFKTDNLEQAKIFAIKLIGDKIYIKHILKKAIKYVKSEDYEKAIIAFQSVPENQLAKPEYIAFLADALYFTNQYEQAKTIYISYYKLVLEKNLTDTRLVDSVKNKNIDRSTLLLLCGADVDQRDSHFYSTGLMFAAQNEDFLHVRLLLKNKADLTTISFSSFLNAFDFAMQHINFEVIAAFIEAGLDVNTRDSTHGSTALMFAAQQGKSDVVIFLLVNGADKTLRSLRHFLTAAEFANSSVIQDYINVY